VAKVVVIDDEASWLSLCEDRLTELGHQVRTSRDCAQALALIRADPPDAVVLDLRMPVSGYVMLLAMREEWPNVPVIVHTVYSGYRNDAGLLKTNAFAVKSPDLAELVASLDRVLAKGRPGETPAVAKG
jgi:DNA-binding NtrC family response regulator